MKRLPVYSDPVCLSVISIGPFPTARSVPTHVPAHVPVTSTVGATVGGPISPAHPAAASTARPSSIDESVFMTVLLSRGQRPLLLHAAVLLPSGTPSNVPPAESFLGALF